LVSCLLPRVRRDLRPRLPPAAASSRCRSHLGRGPCNRLNCAASGRPATRRVVRMRHARTHSGGSWLSAFRRTARSRICKFGRGRASPERRFIDQTAVSAPQPPSPCCGVRAATGPTIRSKSAFEPGMPWIGTCVATSSFSRLRLRYNTTALLFTLAKLPPAGGGP
jgi:hypothetical protein